jgi:hypothetical protein
MKKLLALLVLFSTNTWSKSFSNQYTEFELPPNWECVLEGSEYVCQSTNSDRRKEAIIILAAKIRGAQDTLDKYQAYLKRSKTYQLPGGKTQVSEPKSVKVNKVNNHQWVDALHLASEVPGFYTRYLATVKEDLGVAITFSVVNTKYASYKGIFDNIVKSIKVFRQKKQGLSNIRLAKMVLTKGSKILNLFQTKNWILIRQQELVRRELTVEEITLSSSSSLEQQQSFLFLKRKRNHS